MSENHRNTAAKVTAELNIHLEDHVSTKTVRQELHIYNILGRAATAKAPITGEGGKKKPLKGEKDVVITKLGRLMTGNRNMVLHVVTNMRPGLCLQNAQGSLY